MRCEMTKQASAGDGATVVELFDKDKYKKEKPQKNRGFSINIYFNSNSFRRSVGDRFEIWPSGCAPAFGAFTVTVFRTVP